MRKRGLALLLLIAAPLAAAAGPAHAATPAAKVVDCRTGKVPELRSATFEGRMKTVKGARRMQMRFELLTVSPGADEPQAVKVPELTPWRRSRVGVSAFNYAQTVKGLSSGVTYRARVYFRWLNAAGKVIREEQRESGTCVQDGDLPNLVLGSVKSAPGQVEGTATYTLQVGNTGQGDAESLTVSLFADGAHIDTRTIDGLKSGEFTAVRFTGPYCSRLRAVVDRGATVPETVEEDNELRARCPGPPPRR
jgi:CARDB